MRTRLLVVMALLASALTSATTLLKLDVPGLTQVSDVIVRGRVDSVQAKWSGDRRRIVTEASLTVSEVLKGDVGKTALVVQPGGEVGEVGQIVHGVARFAVGQDVVVFLERRGDRFTVTGMVQGKFTIVNGQARADSDDSLLIDPLTRQPTSPGLTTYAYPELQKLVRAAIGTVPNEPPASGKVPVKP
jgi:hypothetical protein